MREKTRYDHKKFDFPLFARYWEHRCPDCDGVLVLIEEESGVIDRHLPEFKHFYKKWDDASYFGKSNFVWEVLLCRKCGKKHRISVLLGQSPYKWYHVPEYWIIIGLLILAVCFLFLIRSD